jgi:hypothetical protein
VIARLKAALGWLTGSLLGVCVIAAIAALPIVIVLWVGVALGVDWAITAQVRVVIWLSNAVAAANDFLPPWAWFMMITLSWLAFLDVHVRGLVRDEFSKQLKAVRERKLP